MEANMFNEILPTQEELQEIESFVETLEKEELEETAESSGVVLETEKQYYSNISGVKLLTADEERELGEKIVKAREEGDIEIARQYENELVSHNYWLVVKVANKYKTDAFEKVDLIQAGNEGLIKAASGFDATKGYRFSTYAVWWIRQSITRTIYNEGDLVRKPVNTKGQIRRIKKIESELLGTLKRKPTTAEIANAANLSEKRVLELKNYDCDAISLDESVGEEGDITLGDMIAYEDDLLPEEYMILKDRSEIVSNALDKLDERTAKIIRRRMGFDGEVSTLEEIGEELHLTRERVRQIEKKGVKMLSRNPEIRKLM